MTAREFLNQYEYAVERIQDLEDEYEAEQLLIDAVRSASDNDGMPHGSGISKPTENKAERLAEKQQRLVEARLEAIRIRQEVFEVVCQVKGDKGKVLLRFYVYLEGIDDIADTIGYSRRHTYRLLNDAIDEVEIILGTKCHKGS